MAGNRIVLSGHQVMLYTNSMVTRIISKAVLRCDFEHISTNDIELTRVSHDSRDLSRAQVHAHVLQHRPLVLHSAAAAFPPGIVVPLYDVGTPQHAEAAIAHHLLVTVHGHCGHARDALRLRCVVNGCGHKVNRRGVGAFRGFVAVHTRLHHLFPDSVIIKRVV